MGLGGSDHCEENERQHLGLQSVQARRWQRCEGAAMGKIGRR